MSDGVMTNREGSPLSERQVEAALAMSHLWPGKDRDEILATYFDLIRSPEAVRRMAEWDASDAIAPVLHQVRELLLPALLETERRYIERPCQWARVFRRLLSTASHERSEELMFSGFARLRPAKARTTIESESGTQIYVYHTDLQDIGLGARIKRASIEDGSYLANFDAVALGLAESFLQTEEVLHANLFNTGRVYNASICGDGVPLFWEKHPYCSDVYSNVCSRPLNESSLEQVAIDIAKFVDAAGLLLKARPVSLIVPIELERVAARLMQEPTIREQYPEGYCVLDYLRDPRAWFVKTVIPGLQSFQRQPFRLNFAVDDGDLILEGTQSYGVSYNNPRACFASYPKEAA